MSSGSTLLPLSPQTPVNTTNSLIALFREACDVSEDNGENVKVHNRGIIGTLPLDVLEMIKDKVLRLDLCQNRLTHFTQDLLLLSRLKYLDLRQNKFREFPQMICHLPSLSILDISDNKIKVLPESLSSLSTLEILACKRNRIRELPLCLANMPELIELHLEGNPIDYPPSDVSTYFEPRKLWLEQLKEYLRINADRKDGLVAPESGVPTSDEEDPLGRGPWQHFGRTYSIDAMSPQLSHFPNPPIKMVDSTYSTVSSLSPANYQATLAPPPLPFKNHFRVHNGDVQRPGKGPLRTATVMERSRSHSEVSPKVRSQDLPRRRAESAQRNRVRLNQRNIGVENPKITKTHQRGVSHDSVMLESDHHDRKRDIEDQGSRASPVDISQGSLGAYFRRLSVLPKNKRVSLSSIKVVEAARGILFALSQVHQATQQYVQFSGDAVLSGSISRVLYNAKTHVSSLIDALEDHEARGEGSDAIPVVFACNSAVQAFRHVIGILYKHIESLAHRADVRITRTLLLLVYGAAAELHNSWSGLRTCLPVPPDVVSHKALQGSPAISFSAMSNLSNQQGASGRASPMNSRFKHAGPTSSSPSGLRPPTPSGKQEFFTSGVVPPTPTIASSSNSIDVSSTPFNSTDEQLFDKIEMSTTAVVTVMTQLSQAVTTERGPITGNTSAATKLSELVKSCGSTVDVAMRLKSRLGTVARRKIMELTEKRRFREETEAFLMAVVRTATLAKSVTMEFPLDKSSKAGLQTVTRATHDLTLLLQMSSFRDLNPTVQPQYAQQQQASPHSASLNSSGQATPISASGGSSHTSPSNMPTAGNITPNLKGDINLNRFDIALGQAVRAGGGLAGELTPPGASVSSGRDREREIVGLKSPPIVSIPMARDSRD